MLPGPEGGLEESLEELVCQLDVQLRRADATCHQLTGNLLPLQRRLIALAAIQPPTMASSAETEETRRLCCNCHDALMHVANDIIAVKQALKGLGTVALFQSGLVMRKATCYDMSAMFCVLVDLLQKVPARPESE